MNITMNIAYRHGKANNFKADEWYREDIYDANVWPVFTRHLVADDGRRWKIHIRGNASITQLRSAFEAYIGKSVSYNVFLLENQENKPIIEWTRDERKAARLYNTQDTIYLKKVPKTDKRMVERVNVGDLVFVENTFLETDPTIADDEGGYIDDVGDKKLNYVSDGHPRTVKCVEGAMVNVGDDTWIDMAYLRKATTTGVRRKLKGEKKRKLTEPPLKKKKMEEADVKERREKILQRMKQIEKELEDIESN